MSATFRRHNVSYIFLQIYTSLTWQYFSYFPFGNYLQVIGLGTYSQETGSWCLLPILFPREYITSHLQSYRIKITTLNLRAILLISSVSPSLLSAEFKAKSGGDHEPKMPCVWEYPIMPFILFDLLVQHCARHHGRFKGSVLHWSWVFWRQNKIPKWVWNTEEKQLFPETFRAMGFWESP